MDTHPETPSATHPDPEHIARLRERWLERDAPPIAAPNLIALDALIGEQARTIEGLRRENVHAVDGKTAATVRAEAAESERDEARKERDHQSGEALRWYQAWNTRTTELAMAEAALAEAEGRALPPGKVTAEAGWRGFPKVAGTCPACASRELFLASGGWVTCAFIGCPNPTAVADFCDQIEADVVARRVPEPTPEPEPATGRCRNCGREIVRRTMSDGRPQWQHVAIVGGEQCAGVLGPEPAPVTHEVRADEVTPERYPDGIVLAEATTTRYGKPVPVGSRMRYHMRWRDLGSVGFRVEPNPDATGSGARVLMADALLVVEGPPPPPPEAVHDENCCDNCRLPFSGDADQVTLRIMCPPATRTVCKRCARAQADR